MTCRDQTLAELDKAQQRLSRLLLAEPRDAQAIAAAAEEVRRAEQGQARDGGGAG